ncbi:hypothetical protein CR203_11965 [Salipaludibacillus neizhouensis]|uniref:Uncharacterized protein n=1 Tax=Salipaludibacillus neizhouensis TaxID=885475 RepID=A0A3A9K6Y9_9BACI|nr:hypothetical protein [Salipaludibacillus neizhouensis]RKL67218.1 hypothetical protein CR203_11965 [Salipaludibacillus neizhouensis]
MNMEKLLFVGIPFLYLCCYPIFYFHAPILTLPSGKLNLILLSHSFTQIAGIIFGYMLITSFYKVSKYPVIIGR